MSLGQVVLLVYAVLMVLGGMAGYRAGSKVSLIAGAASGVLLLAALLLSYFRPVAGLWSGAVIAMLLALSFAMRVRKTGKLMPGGALLLLSLFATALLVYAAQGVTQAGS